MTIDIRTAAVIAVVLTAAAILLGFVLGRTARRAVGQTGAVRPGRGLAETGAGNAGRNPAEDSGSSPEGNAARSTVRRAEAEKAAGNLRRGRKGAKVFPGQPIGSPASGKVMPICEERRCGVWIRPEQEKVYAPVSGRIRKLYPMGNSMLLAADCGVEVLLQVCPGVDELCSMYFRPRVLPNELVNKGKLLLEFDREGLERQGVDVVVAVSVEDFGEDKKTAVTPKSRVTAGEDLLWA